MLSVHCVIHSKRTTTLIFEGSGWFRLIVGAGLGLRRIFRLLVLRCAERCFGGHSGGETPGYIPNPVAKPSSADGTALVRVWESRTPPDSTLGKAHPGDRVGLFAFMEKNPMRVESAASRAMGVMGSGSAGMLGPGRDWRVRMG